jgi:hypothetical protein
VQGGGGHDGHTNRLPETSEEPPIQDGSVYLVARQLEEQGTDVCMQQAESHQAQLCPEEERQNDRLDSLEEGAVALSITIAAQCEHDTPKALKVDDEAEAADEMPPPRITASARQSPIQTHALLSPHLAAAKDASASAEGGRRGATCVAGYTASTCSTACSSQRMFRHPHLDGLCHHPNGLRACECQNL